MNRIKIIRDRLGQTQAELGRALGMTQGNVAFYERGQTVPPEVAKRLIVHAANHGVTIGYEDVYGPADLDAVAEPVDVTAGIETAAAGQGA